MIQDHHPLAQDFPQYKNKIHTLKQQDAHFARLYQAYEDLDKAVVRLETRVELASDAELEDKKVQRVRIKDELYSLLQQA